MIRIITILIAIFFYEGAHAQYAYFATRGKITYDKTTYIRARLRGMQKEMEQNNQGRFGGGRMFDLENIPESTTEKYILEFDENTTLMYIDADKQTNTAGNNRNQGAQIRAVTSRTGQGRGAGMNQGGVRASTSSSRRPASSSKILFQNLQNNTSEVQVEIDDKYILSDSLNQITWRFSDEYRNIAGYECRRVNGATKDSLYLVAFYTEEIPISGGPALTQGLPGMILGLAIPEMNIQYWATKVDYTTEIVSKDWKDKKAKKMKLDDFVNSFGRYFQRGGDNNSSMRQVLESLIY